MFKSLIMRFFAPSEIYAQLLAILTIDNINLPSNFTTPFYID